MGANWRGKSSTSLSLLPPHPLPFFEVDGLRIYQCHIFRNESDMLGLMKCRFRDSRGLISCIGHVINTAKFTLEQRIRIS